MKPASTSTNEISARLLSSDYAPQLRPDAKLVRLTVAPGFRLADGAGSRWVDLSALDCALVQEMDGTHSLVWLAEFARRRDPSMSAGYVERLVADLYSRELLVAIVPPPPGSADERGARSAQDERKEGKVVPLGARRPADEYSDFREELSDAFSDQSTADRSSVVPTLRPAGRGAGMKEALRPDTTDRSDDADAEEATAVPAPYTEEEPDESESADGETEGEGDGEQGEEQGTETTEGVEAEQQQLWQEMRAIKWHQRGWVRALLVLGGLIVIAAIVPYPLRITSEAVIIPTERAYVRTKTAGIIAEIKVDEGQAVRKGDVLARLDDRELRTDRLKAVAEIEKIQAEMARLKRGARSEEIAGQSAVVAAAGNEVAFARKEAVRKARMAAQGVGSAQARDQARHELRVKQKALAEASARLRLLKAGSRTEDIEARQAELDRAKAHLAFVDEQLALTVIQAPIDGVLLTPKFRERLHEKIEAGGMVCEIAKTSRMRAEVYMSEREMDSVAIGQPVVVKVQSYPTREFTGKVDFLAPAVEKRGDDNRMRVVVELDNAEGLLKQDMTGYGEINCGRRTVLNLVTRRLLRWVRVRFLL
jgi:multidrug resistance efflux pump